MNSSTINDDVTIAGRASVLASRYRIVRQLGAGGMGSVWLAEDMQLDNKLFAIKMLPSILVANKRAYNQLKAEALVAMKLVHPNIVQIRAFEENNGNPFLVMDYIDGETLDDYLAQREEIRVKNKEGEVDGRASVPASRIEESGISEEEVVKLLKPIAEALDYAHGEGVIHRDIKPANVIIRKDGRPFVLDFGIAREIQETLTRVTGRMSSGTLMYMSPEQLNGDMPKKEQDIYSFAAMVYECIKGEPPFCRGAIEDQIKHKDPEPLTHSPSTVLADGRASVPASRLAIADAVMRGLAKKPEDRPKSCVAVLEKKFNRVDRADRVELGNEIPLEDFPYLPSDMRMRKGITATQSQSGENAELSKSHVEDHAQASGIIEKQVTSTEEKKTTLFFWGFVVVVLMIVSLSKFYDIRQARIQQEEQQKIVAEQKRLAMEARIGASMAQKEAEKNDAKKLAVEEYDAAIMMKGLADNAWSVLHYETAKNRFLNARDLFAKSVKVAQRNKGRQHTYQSKSEQQEVKTERQEVKNIKPELRVNAMLLGNNVHGAKINDGVRDHITPIRWTLENGKTYGPFNVTYENNGRKYSGKLDAVKVDWLGVREKSVVLTEDVDFSLIEKTENTRKAIEAFKAKRYDEAYRLFMKSDLEDKEVQYFMGHLYGSGHGVLKNEYEAVKWYRKAAEQGHCGAQVFLGVRYANGQGVVKDEYEAIKWFRKAADLGNVFSLYKLGEMYENGRGVLRDIEEAKKWYRKAAGKGHENAKKALERLENVRVVKSVKYVQPVASQPQQPVLIDRPHNLKYCDNCGHALWRFKKISPRCEKCGVILFTPEAPPKDTTGKDVEALGNLLRGIGGGF